MDGILDAVRRRLKGVSSDGASVMYGRKVIFNCILKAQNKLPGSKLYL